MPNLPKNSLTKNMTYLMYDETLGAGLYEGVGCKNSMKKDSVVINVLWHQLTWI